jgi:hypothetical protein
VQNLVGQDFVTQIISCALNHRSLFMHTPTPRM